MESIDGVCFRYRDRGLVHLVVCLSVHLHMVRVHTLAAQSPLNVSDVLHLHAQLVLDGLHGLVAVLVSDEHPPVSRVGSLTLYSTTV